MNNVLKKKRANKSSLPFFLKSSFKVSFIIILISLILLITTFTFDTVPPILNRGIQPATFPKALLVLIIFLTSFIFYLSIKTPWKKESKLPKSFFITLIAFVLFLFIAKTLDFFLAIAVCFSFSFLLLGRKKNNLSFIVSILFPIIVFIFFETFLGLRFPPGIITNIYYN